MADEDFDIGIDDPEIGEDGGKKKKKKQQPKPPNAFNDAFDAAVASPTQNGKQPAPTNGKAIDFNAAFDKAVKKKETVSGTTPEPSQDGIEPTVPSQSPSTSVVPVSRNEGDMFISVDGNVTRIDNGVEITGSLATDEEKKLLPKETIEQYRAYKAYEEGRKSGAATPLVDFREGLKLNPNERVRKPAIYSVAEMAKNQNDDENVLIAAAIPQNFPAQGGGGVIKQNMAESQEKDVLAGSPEAVASVIQKEQQKLANQKAKVRGDLVGITKAQGYGANDANLSEETKKLESQIVALNEENSKLIGIGSEALDRIYADKFDQSDDKSENVQLAIGNELNAQKAKIGAAVAYNEQKGIVDKKLKRGFKPEGIILLPDYQTKPVQKVVKDRNRVLEADNSMAIKVGQNFDYENRFSILNAVVQQKQDQLNDPAVDQEQTRQELVNTIAQRDNLINQYPEVKAEAQAQLVANTFANYVVRARKGEFGELEKILAGRSVVSGTALDDEFEIKRVAELSGLSEDEVKKYADEAKIPSYLGLATRGFGDVIKETVQGLNRFSMSKADADLQNRIIEKTKYHAPESLQLSTDNINPDSILSTMFSTVGAVAAYGLEGYLGGEFLGAATGLSRVARLAKADLGVLSTGEQILPANRFARLMVNMGVADSEGQALGQIIKATAKAKNVSGTYSSMYAASYEAAYQQAAQITDDEEKRKQYAGSMATANGLAMVVLNPANLVSKAVRNVLPETVVGNVLKEGGEIVPKNIFRARLDEIAKTTGLGTAQSLIPVINEHLAKSEIFDYHTSASEFANHALNSAMNMTIGILPLGVLGALKIPSSNYRKSIVYEVGKNPAPVRLSIEQMFNRGEITNDEKNSQIAIVNTLTDLVKNVPDKNNDGKPLSQKEKNDLVYHQLQNGALRKKQEVSTPDVQPHYEKEVKENGAVINEIMQPKPEPKTDDQWKQRIADAKTEVEKEQLMQKHGEWLIEQQKANEQQGEGVGNEGTYNERKLALEDKLNKQLEDNKDRLDDIEDKGGTQTVRQKIYKEHTNDMVELERWKMKEDLKTEKVNEQNKSPKAQPQQGETYQEKKANIEKRRQEELGAVDKKHDETTFNTPQEKAVAKERQFGVKGEINDRYNAELDKLRDTTPEGIEEKRQQHLKKQKQDHPDNWGQETDNGDGTQSLNYTGRKFDGGMNVEATFVDKGGYESDVTNPYNMIISTERPAIIGEDGVQKKAAVVKVGKFRDKASAVEWLKIEREKGIENQPRREAKINAKYDAELAALQKVKANEQNKSPQPQQAEVVGNEAKIADIENTDYGTLSGTKPLSEILKGEEHQYYDLGDNMSAVVYDNGKIAVLMDKNYPVNGRYVAEKAFSKDGKFSPPNYKNVELTAKANNQNIQDRIGRLAKATELLNSKANEQNKSPQPQQAEVVGNEEYVSKYPRPKTPISQMTSEQLVEHSKEVKKYLKDVEVDMFGEEGAKKYREAQSVLNSSYISTSDPKYKESSDLVNKMEGSLSTNQQKEFFGIGETGEFYEPSELRDIATRVRLVEESENSSDLGGALKLPLLEFNRNQSEASLAVLNAAKKKATELGLDPKEVFVAAIKRIGNDLSDKADAAMLAESIFEKIQIASRPKSISNETPNPKSEVITKEQQAEYDDNLKQITKDDATTKEFEDYLNQDAEGENKLELGKIPEVTTPEANQGNETIQREKIQPITEDVTKPTTINGNEKQSGQSREEGRQESGQESEISSEKGNVAEIVEQGGEADGGAPPFIETGSSGVFVERPGTELSFRGLQNVSNEFGYEDVKSRDRVSDLKEQANARQTIAEWVEKGDYSKNINDLLTKIQDKELVPTARQRLVLQQHVANEVQKLRNIKDKSSKEFDDQFKEVKRIKDIGLIARQETGAALRVGNTPSSPVADYGDAMVAKAEANGVDVLTDAQKAEVDRQVKVYEEKTKVAEDKVKLMEEKMAELEAQKELNRQNKKSTTPKDKSLKKTAADFQAERERFKQELQDAKKEHEQWLKDQGIQKAGFSGITLTPKMIKAIGKIIGSHVEEFGNNLAEITKKVFDEIKDLFPGITQQDIHNVIAGEYAQQRPTRTQLQKDLKDLRDEAYYINKLDRLVSGTEPKSEKAKVERNRNIKELQDKIKEFKKENPDQKASLEAAKKRNEDRTKQINEAIKNKDFNEKPKATSIYDNAELQKKYPKQYREALDALHEKEEAKLDFDLALMKDRVSKMNFLEKTGHWTKRVIGTTKALKSGVDDSGILVQNVLAMIAHPRTGAKAFRQHALDAFSEKRYNRWLTELHNNTPVWDLIKKSELNVTEPGDLRESNREEAFSYNLLDRTKFGKYFLKPFERAFTSIGNAMRVNFFLEVTNKWQQEGITFENSPQDYKSLAAMLNTETGRGNLHKNVQRASELVTAGIWSPRLMASRLNILGLSDIASPITGKGYYAGLSPRVRKIAAQDVGKFITTGLTLMAFASLAGLKVDLDTDSPTFGTIRIGKKRINVFDGFSKYARTTSRLISGSEGRGKTLGKFFRGSTTPATGVALDVITGKDYTGQPITPEGELKNLVAPMSASGIVKEVQRDGMVGLVSGLGQFFGANITDERDYEDDRLKDVPQSVRADYERTNDREFLPPKVMPTITYHGQDIKLSDKKHNEFSDLVEKERTPIVEKIVNSDTYKKMSDDDRKRMLTRAYDHGRDLAKLKFLNDNKDLIEKADKELKEKKSEAEKQKKERSQ